MSEIGSVRANCEATTVSNKTKPEAKNTESNKSIFLEDDGNGTFEMTDIKSTELKNIGALKVLLKEYVGKPLADITNAINTKIDEFLQMNKEDKALVVMNDFAKDLADYVTNHGTAEGFNYSGGLPVGIQDLHTEMTEIYSDTSNDGTFIEDGKLHTERRPDGFKVTITFHYNGKAHTVEIKTNGVVNPNNTIIETMDNEPIKFKQEITDDD